MPILSADNDDDVPVPVDLIHEVSDDDSVRRQVFSPRMYLDRRRNERADYPQAAFDFQLREDGERSESIVIGSLASEMVTHQKGAEKAAADRAKKLELNPDVSPEALPSYVGYIEARAGDVRTCAAAGVFRVSHVPAQGFFAHGHVTLAEDFLERMNSTGINASPGGGTLNRKNAFVIARDKLVLLFCERFVEYVVLH